MRYLYLAIAPGLWVTSPATGQSDLAAPDTAALKRPYSLFRPVPKELLRDFTPDRPGISQSAHTVDAGHF